MDRPGTTSGPPPYTLVMRISPRQNLLDRHAGTVALKPLAAKLGEQLQERLATRKSAASAFQTLPHGAPGFTIGVGDKAGRSGGPSPRSLVMLIGPFQDLLHGQGGPVWLSGTSATARGHDASTLGQQRFQGRAATLAAMTTAQGIIKGLPVLAHCVGHTP